MAEDARRKLRAFDEARQRKVSFKDPDDAQSPTLARRHSSYNVKAGLKRAASDHGVVDLYLSSPSPPPPEPLAKKTRTMPNSYDGGCSTSLSDSMITKSSPSDSGKNSQDCSPSRVITPEPSRRPPSHDIRASIEGNAVSPEPTPTWLKPFYLYDDDKIVFKNVHRGDWKDRKLCHHCFSRHGEFNRINKNGCEACGEEEEFEGHYWEQGYGPY